MRKISIVTAALILALLLSSCGLIKINRPEDDTTVQSTIATTPAFDGTDPPESVETQLPPEIPEVKEWEIREKEADAFLSSCVNLSFKGSTLFIVDSTSLFSSPLIENNIYSEAVYERNKKVTNRHSFTLTVASADSSTLFDDFKATLQSGETYSDLLCVKISDSGKYIASGLIKNLRTLPFFESSADYTVDSFDKSLSAGNDAFISAGYHTLTPSDLSAVYFNKSILKNADVDLYNEILYGDFTIERYYELLTLCESGSIVSPSLDATLISLTASGSSFLGGGYGNVISISQESAVETVKKAGGYLSSLLFSSLEDVTAENEFSLFEDGKALFRVGVLSDMDTLYEDKLLWGIAPMPKSDSADVYSTPVNSSMACLLIPSNTAKSELTSVALNAFSASSYKWLLDSAGFYYTTYRVPDIYAPEVIKLITENPVLDFASGGVSLSDKFNDTLFSQIGVFAKDNTTDLTQILTATKIKAVVTELKKYYS